MGQQVIFYSHHSSKMYSIIVCDKIHINSAMGLFHIYTGKHVFISVIVCFINVMMFTEYTVH